MLQILQDETGLRADADALFSYKNRVFLYKNRPAAASLEGTAAAV
jgi:hypothetical protein